MTDIYTPEEFALCFSLRGYGRKKEALKWLQDHDMTEAGEDDFERCYHDLNVEMILPHTRPFIALRRDGQNYSAPQHQPNSRGDSFAKQMLRELRITDAYDRAIRRSKEDDAHE